MNQSEKALIDGDIWDVNQSEKALIDGDINLYNGWNQRAGQGVRTSSSQLEVVLIKQKFAEWIFPTGGEIKSKESSRNE